MPLGDDIRDSIISAEIRTLRLSASVRRQILSTLHALELELTALVNGIDPTSPSRELYRMQRLAKLLNEANLTIGEHYKIIESAYNETMGEFASWTVRDGAARINKVIGADLVSAGQLPRQMSAFAKQALFEGSPSKEWWTAQRRSVQERFKRAMRIGTAQGETLSDLVARVRGREATATRVGHTPILDVSRKEAELLVRTSLININNAGKLKLYEESLDVFVAIKWVSTLDNRTTPICQALDGKMWTLPDYQPIGHKFPFPGATAHWGCRSVQVPVSKEWEELVKDKKVAEVLSRLNKSERASMDGPIPSGITYEAWLKKQSADRQNDVLGVTKGKLFRQGKLTLSQMVDMNGRPLTLKELGIGE